MASKRDPIRFLLEGLTSSDEDTLRRLGLGRDDVYSALHSYGIRSVRDFAKRSPAKLSSATGLPASFIEQWQNRMQIVMRNRPVPKSIPATASISDYGDTANVEPPSERIRYEDVSKNPEDINQLYAWVFGYDNKNARIVDDNTIVYTHHWRSGAGASTQKEETYQIRYDSNAGGIFVSRDDRAQSAFGVFDYIQSLGSAEKGWLTDNVLHKTEVLRRAVSQEKQSLIPFLQGYGARHINLDTMRLNPVIRVLFGYGRALPRTEVEEAGLKRTVRDYGAIADWLLGTGQEKRWALPGGGATLLPLEIITRAMYPTDIRDGELTAFGATKPKHSKTFGMNEPAGMFLTQGPSATTAMPRYAMPLRMSGAPDSFQGNIATYTFLSHNIFFSEGEQLLGENYGYLGEVNTMVISAEQAARLKVGDVFTRRGHTPPVLADHQRIAGPIRDFKEMLNVQLGSHDVVAVEDLIDLGEGQFQLTWFKGKSTNTSANKSFGIKANTRPIDPAITQALGTTFITGMPSAEGAASIGLNSLQARYANNPAGLRDVFINYVKGRTLNGETIDDEMAERLYNEGVVGGPNAEFWAELGLKTFQESRLAKPVTIPGRFVSHDQIRRLLGGYAGRGEIFDEGHYRTLASDMKQLQAAIPTLPGGHPILTLRRPEEGGFIVDIHDTGYQMPVFVRMRPEYAQPQRNISFDDLNQIARYLPDTYAFLKQGIEYGAYGSTAQDLILTTRANYDEASWERLVNTERLAPILASDIDMVAARAEALKDMPEDAPEGRQTRALLSQLASMYGGRALQVGNYVLPSFEVARSMHTMNEDEQSISNYAFKLFQAIEAEQNLRAMALTEAEDSPALLRAVWDRDYAGWEALRSAGQLIEAVNRSGERSGTGSAIVQAALGLQGVTMMSAAVVSAPEVPANAMVARAEDLFLAMNARTAEERLEVMRLYEQGELPAHIYRRWPGNEAALSALALELILYEDLVKRPGHEHFRLAPGQIAVNPAAQQAVSGDYDSDFGVAMPTAMYMDTPTGRRLVRSSQRPMTPEQILSIARYSYGGEQAKQLKERFGQSIDQYAAAVAANPLAMKISDIAKGFLTSSAFGLLTKGGIGTWYNAFIRQYTPLIGHGLDTAVASGAITRDVANQIELAASHFASLGPQLSIDAPEDQPGSMKKIKQLLSTLRYDSSKFPGVARPGYHPGDGHTWKTFADINEQASFVLRAIVSAGVDSEHEANVRRDLEWQLPPMYMAGDPAVRADVAAMLGAFRDKRISFEEFQTQFLTRIGAVDDAGNIAPWLWYAGSPSRGGIEQLSAAALPFLASEAYNTLKSNPDKYPTPHHLPALMALLAPVANAVRGLRSLKRTSDVEQALAMVHALRETSPALRPAAADVLDLLGYGGPAGEDMQAALRSLSPTGIFGVAGSEIQYVERVPGVRQPVNPLFHGDSKPMELNPLRASSWGHVFGMEKLYEATQKRVLRTMTALQLAVPQGQKGPNKWPEYQDRVMKELLKIDPHLYGHWRSGSGAMQKGTLLHQEIQKMMGLPGEVEVANSPRISGGHIDMLLQMSGEDVVGDIKTTHEAELKSWLTKPDYFMSRFSNQIIQYVEGAEESKLATDEYGLVFPLIQPTGKTYDRAAIVESLQKTYELMVAQEATNPLVAKGLELSRQWWGEIGIPMVGDVPNWEAVKAGTGPIPLAGIYMPMSDYKGIRGMRPRADEFQATLMELIQNIPGFHPSLHGISADELEKVIPAADMAKALHAFGTDDEALMELIRSRMVTTPKATPVPLPAPAGAAGGTGATGGAGTPAGGSTGGASMPPPGGGGGPVPLPGGASMPPPGGGGGPVPPPGGGGGGSVPPPGGGGGGVSVYNYGDTIYSKVSQPRLSNQDIARVEVALNYFKRFGDHLQGIGEQLRDATGETEKYNKILAENEPHIKKAAELHGVLVEQLNKYGLISGTPQFVENMEKYSPEIWRRFSHLFTDPAVGTQTTIGRYQELVESFSRAVEQMKLEDSLSPYPDTRQRLREMSPYDIWAMPGKQGLRYRQMAESMGLLDDLNVRDKLRASFIRTVQEVVDPGTLWMLRAARSMFIQPVTRAANEYQGQAVSDALMLIQSGQIPFEQMTGTQGGLLLRRESQRANAAYYFGEQAYHAWQPLLDLTISPEAARGFMGAAASIVLPSLGAGALASYLGSHVGALSSFGAALGLPALLAVATAGTASYIAGNAENIDAIVRGGTLLENPAGAAGQFANQFERQLSGWMAQSNATLGNPVTPATQAQQQRWNQVDQAPEMNRLIEDFLAGQINRVQFLDPAIASAYSEADRLSLAANRWIENAVTQWGVGGDSRSSIAQLYARFARYGIDVPPMATAEAAYGLDIMGINYEQIAQLRLGGQLRNPANLRLMGAEMVDVINTISGSPDKIQASIEQTYGASYQQRINPSRALAGQPILPETAFIGTDPLINDFIAQVSQPWITQQATSNVWTTPANMPYTMRRIESYLQAARVASALFPDNPEIAGDQLGQLNQHLSQPFMQALVMNRWPTLPASQANQAIDLLMDAASDVGLTPQASQQLQLMYVLAGPQAQDIFTDPAQMVQLAGITGALQAGGINVTDLIAGRLGGQAPTRAVTSDIAVQLAADLTGAYGFDATELEYYAGGRREAMNRARRMAGRREADPRNTILNEILADEVTGSAYVQVDQLRSEMVASGFSYVTNMDLITTQTRLQDMASDRVTVPQALIGNRQLAAWNQLAQGWAAYGMDDNRIGRLLSGATFLSPEQNLIALQAAQGNPYALNRLGFTQYTMIDPVSGRNRFAESISDQELAMLQAVPGDWFRLTGSAARMGTDLWQTQIRDISRTEQRAQYQMDVLQRQIQRTMLWGDINDLGPMYAQFGVSFDAGNGMNIWQLEDASRALSRQQQDFGLNLNFRQFSLRERQYALADRQFMERYDLSGRQFQADTAYQRWQMDFSREKQLVTRGWTAEDLSFNRSRMDLEFGWQQEDFDREIRYSRGRQRRQLMREQERSVIRYSMEAGRADREQERFHERNQWEDELFRKQKEHFEQQVRFAEEQRQLQLQHFEQDKQLRNENMTLQKEHLDQQRQWLQENWELEDQRILQDRQHTVAMIEAQAQIAERSNLARESLWLFEDALTAASNATQMHNDKMQMLVSTGEMAATVLEKVAGGLMNVAGAGQQALSGLIKGSGGIVVQNKTVTTVTGAVGTTSSVHVPTATVGGSNVGSLSNWQNYAPGTVLYRGYKEGGYTGDGDPNAIAGFVHKREIVVPERGTLVLHSDRTNQLLKEQIALTRAQNQLLAQLVRKEPVTISSGRSSMLSLDDISYGVVS